MKLDETIKILEEQHKNIRNSNEDIGRSIKNFNLILDKYLKMSEQDRGRFMIEAIIDPKNKEAVESFDATPISPVPDLLEPNPSQLIYLDLQDKSQLIPPPLEPIPAEKKKSRVKIILLVLLIVILVFCVIPWIIVDATRSYCSLLPWLFNCS